MLLSCIEEPKLPSFGAPDGELRYPLDDECTQLSDERFECVRSGEAAAFAIDDE